VLTHQLGEPPLEFFRELRSAAKEMFHVAPL
jgi:hypothetical protein